VALAEGGEESASFERPYSTQTPRKGLMPEERFALMLGEKKPNPQSPPNGILEAGEREVDKPFLLWSAGPDGQFGPDDEEDLARCDDVTNFQD
jgi:hypothetical protein